MNTEFLLTSLIVVLIPGTGVIYTVSTGLFKGWRASIAAALGCTAGIIPHLAACVLGLSAILHMSAVAFQVLKMAGAVYLFYLAWSMWREKGGLSFDAVDSSRSLGRIAIRAVMINILNPKLTIFFLAFLPMFISSDVASPVPQLLVLSAVFMALTAIVFIAYGLLANSVRDWIIGSEKRVRNMQRSFAAVFAGLGIKLALSD